MVGTTAGIHRFGRNRQQDIDRATLKAALHGRLSAQLLIHSVCQDKYGSLLNVLDQQLNMGNDQWPKTTEEAGKLLSKHKLDNKRGEFDEDSKEDVSFAQRDVSKLTCNCCGVVGHTSLQCDKRFTIPPEKWFKPKEVKSAKKTKTVHNQMSTNTDTNTENEQTESEAEPSSEEKSRTVSRQQEARAASKRRTGSKKSTKKSRDKKGCSQSAERKGWYGDDDDDGWAALQFQSHIPIAHPGGIVFQQKSTKSKWSALLQDTIILDTGSTISGTVMNPDFVTDIKPATKPITMSTNAGSKHSTMDGKVPGFGPVFRSGSDGQHLWLQPHGSAVPYHL
jgi:hypothetical protein